MNKMNNMYYGLDISSTNIGVYGQNQKGNVIYTSHKKIESKRFVDKLKEIRDFIFHLPLKDEDIVVFEDCFQSINKNVNRVLSMCLGAAVSGLSWCDCDILFIHPKEARKIVFGNGNIKKEDIQNGLKKLKKDYKNEHINDAVVIVLAYLSNKVP